MSSGLYCYRVKQDNFNLNNYTVDDVAKLHNPEKNLIKQTFYLTHYETFVYLS